MDAKQELRDLLQEMAVQKGTFVFRPVAHLGITWEGAGLGR